MKHSKRIISILLTLVMLVSLCTVLTGCGGDEDSGKTNTDGFVYVPNYLTISRVFDYGIQSMKYANDQFYFMSEVLPEGVSAEAPNSWEKRYTGLFTMDMEGNVTELGAYEPDVLPEGVEGYCSIRGIEVDKEGNILVLSEISTHHFDLPADFDEATDDKWNYYVDSASEYTLKKLNPDGSLNTQIDLSGIVSDENYLYSFICDDAGNIYLIFDMKAVVLDPNGAELFTYESENWMESGVKLKDGSVGVTMYQDGYQLIRLDVATKQGEVYCDLPNSAWGLQQGFGDYDAFYTNGANLMGIKIADGVATEEKILNWINCDVDSDRVMAFVALEDGNIAAVIQEWNDTTSMSEMNLVTLTKTPAKDVEQKTTLTLAMQYLDWEAKDAVLKFNRTNPDYRIEILDYSEYNTEEDYQAGVKKLTTEILSGDVPDIIYTSGLPVEQMAAKGLLVDLYTLMENDSEISKDDFIPSILALMETDGKLYRTCQRFYIMTVIGNSDIVGEEPGWTMDEFMAAYQQMPEGATIFDESVTRANILQICLMMDQNSFVDWATGECSFDSEAFVDMLEFAKLFPSEFDWENYDYENYESENARIANGKQMLMATGLSDTYDMQYYTAAFGDKAVFKGFPTTDGVGNAIQLYDGYAISSKCEYKEAAWEFVRQFMTSDDEYSWGFSPIQKVFDARLEEAMTPVYVTDENGEYVLDENGNKIEQSQGGWSDGYNNYEYYSMTQEQADQLMELINNTTKLMTTDTSLYDIILEEAEAFFSDQKSAEETAKMIQSRVSLYVKEQA